MDAPPEQQPQAPRAQDVLRSPVCFLAFGGGSGLSPRAPGTVGTLAAIPLYWLFSGTGLVYYSLIVAAAALLGIWICAAASRRLGVHDHPGIVWDEFVGYWITMWAVPVDWPWVLAGFAAFRVFDILKPWPVSWLDRRVAGGFGIMVDDIAAGVMACLVLHAARVFFG